MREDKKEKNTEHFVFHILYIYIYEMCLGICHIDVNSGTNYKELLISIQLSQKKNTVVGGEKEIREIKAF